MAEYKNSILSALDSRDLALIRPHLTEMKFEQRHVLYAVGEPIENLYFMETGVASVLNTMANGSTIEVGMIGYEGMVGISTLLGDTESSHEIVIQIAGTGRKISALHCKKLFESNEPLRKGILRFVDSFLNLSSQTAACNRLHLMEQRCARWLLMSSDRACSNELPLTQEYLASMIGVRRSGVTEAAGELQRSGLIAYTKGQISIIDREGMEKAACECYRLDQDRFERLIAPEKT